MPLSHMHAIADTVGGAYLLPLSHMHDIADNFVTAPHAHPLQGRRGTMSLAQ